jgi:plastocyanin
MRRREFLRTAGGVSGTTAGVAAAGSAAAAEDGTPTATPGGGGNETATGTATGGTTHTVNMTDGLVFDPDSLTIAPGDTVEWVNVGAIGHSVTAYEENIPDGAEYFASGGFDSEQAARDDWTGAQEGNVPGGESYSHTFQTEGSYEYFCIPHEGAGMLGAIEVSSGGGGGEGGGEEVDPEEMGVPFQAHWVGVATLLGIGLALLLTFFFLKYGETPHSGYPEER